MNAKSNIFKQLELIECSNRVKNFVERLFETYNIDDIVVGMVNSEPQEIVKGFMTNIVECETIDDCFNRYNAMTDCVRIYEGKYFIGKYTNDINECKNASMNIETFREF